MQLFYSDHQQDNYLFLTPEESHHAAKVLRIKEGEIVHVTDGKGSLYKGEVIRLDHKRGMIEVLSSERTAPRKASLHIAIAPTKNTDRFEWFLEKACEFGIERITPIICKRSERKELRTDRLQKILIAGMKQSLHYYLPRLEEVVSFSSFIKSADADNIKCIAHCEKKEKKIFKEVLLKKSSMLVLIGPEGDFTGEEIQSAVENSFIEISLGNSRLRTETAGIAVAHSFAEMLEEN